MVIGMYWQRLWRIDCSMIRPSLAEDNRFPSSTCFNKRSYIFDFNIHVSKKQARFVDTLLTSKYWVNADFQNLESLDFKYRSKMDKFVRKIVLYKYPRVVNNKVGNCQGDWRFAEKKNFVLRCIEIFYRLLSKSIKLFISSGEATRQTRITITAPI